MRSLLVFLLTCSGVRAGIDGTVVNLSAGIPQPGVTIALATSAPTGLQTMDTALSGPSGHFLLRRDKAGLVRVLLARFKGVDYYKYLAPDASTSNLQVDVFESTKSPAVAHIVRHMLFVAPGTNQISVAEVVTLENNSKSTFHNLESGDLRFFLPPVAAGHVSVMARGTQTMPSAVPAQRAGERDVYKVDFPVKPGRTDFEIRYALHVRPAYTLLFRIVGISGMSADPLRLIAPSGVIFASEDIRKVGTEPKSAATLYNVIARSEFSLKISGLGLLPQPDTLRLVAPQAAR